MCLPRTTANHCRGKVRRAHPNLPSAARVQAVLRGSQGAGGAGKVQFTAAWKDARAPLHREATAALAPGLPDQVAPIIVAANLELDENDMATIEGRA
jgi:hypothetical protein